MGNIAFIVDSGASFPKKWYEQHGIHVVQLGLTFPNGKRLREFDITPQKFYAKLRLSKELPKTTVPGPREFAKAYDSALDTGAEHAIMLTLMGEKSSTYHVAASVANGELREGNEKYKGRVTVIDTHTVGPAQGFIALGAKRFAESHSLEETIGHVEALTQNTKVYLVPKTLECLHNGGRLSGMEFFLGSMLKIVPVISVKRVGDDRYDIVAVSKSHTMIKAVNAMLNYVTKDSEDAINRGLRTVDVMVMHGDNEGLARTVADMTLQRLAGAGLSLGIHPTKENPYVYITPVIGTHAGPGSVGVAMLYRK